VPYFDRFEIDIISALSSQLIAALAKLTPVALTHAHINALEKGQGVYQLYYQGTLVYVGKADSLRRRLTEHEEKILGRNNINIADMGFTCLFVHPNWTSLAPEDSLIKYYRKTGGGECAWNGNGFGPHDPGRERETTNKPPDGFDALYPIKNDWPCPWITAGQYDAYALLKSLKGKLPYLLRFQTVAQGSQKPHADYLNVTINVPQDGMTATELLRLIAQALPAWQATAFPSHMILYKEDRPYAHGKIIWPT
jgi:hypothetical protein